MTVSRNGLQWASAWTAWAILVLAYCAGAYAWPGPGERPVPVNQVWAARCGMVCLLAFGQVVLFSTTLPLFFHPRQVYQALTLLASLIGLLAGICAAVFWMAGL